MTTQTMPSNLHSPQSNFAITNPTKRSSKALYGFGIAEIVLSILLFSSCLWSSSVDSSIVTAYFGFASAIFHAILGGLAVTAGRDLDRFRGCLISCLIMGIIGSCIFVVSTITADSIEWSNYSRNCWRCQYPHKNKHDDDDDDDDFRRNLYRCVRICMFPSGSLFLPILFFCLIGGIVGIVLSSIACCSFTSCCKQQSPTIINTVNSHNAYPQPNAPALPMQPQTYPQQHHVNYPPPNYSETASPSQTAFAGIHQSNVMKYD